MIIRLGETGVVSEGELADWVTLHPSPTLSWHVRQGVFFFTITVSSILVLIPRGLRYTLYTSNRSQITQAPIISLWNATGFCQFHAPLRQIMLASDSAGPRPSILSPRILSLSKQVSPHGWADLWDAPAGERNVQIKTLQISLKTHWLLPINLCP